MNINKLLNNASDYVLNNENILNILNNSSNINIQKTRKINDNKNINSYNNNKKYNNDNLFFYPEDKYTNKLFWCWFIFVNNLVNIIILLMFSKKNKK